MRRIFLAGLSLMAMLGLGCRHPHRADARATSMDPSMIAHRAVPAGPRFSLRFLRGGGPFVYRYDQWLAIVQSLDLSATRAVIDEGDVETYTVHREPSPCIDLGLTPHATARLTQVQNEIIEVPVAVLLDGNLLYAAKEYVRYGAAAIQFPIVDRMQLNQRVLHICGSLIGAGEVESRRIDRPELRELFGALGRLRQVP